MNDDTAGVTLTTLSSPEDDFQVSAVLDSPVQGGFSLILDNRSGTATLFDDYEDFVVELEFEGTAGEIQRLPIRVLPDAAPERDETFVLRMRVIPRNNLSSTSEVGILNPANVTLTRQQTLTILNDDFVEISVDDPTVSEGNSGTTNLSFEVSLSALAPAGGVSLDYATSPGGRDTGTGAGSSDFTPQTGQITFPANTTTQRVTVLVLGDNIVEPDEVLTLTLSNPLGTATSIADGTGIGTIVNDDTATVTAVDKTVEERSGDRRGTVTIDYRLNTPVQGGFTINGFQIVNQTTDDNDHTGFVGSPDPAVASLEFAGTAGEVQSLRIGVSDDPFLEADETLIIVAGVLQSDDGIDLSDIAISDPVALTIRNDDFANLDVYDANVVEGDSGTTDLVFEIELDAAGPQEDVIISYRTADGDQSDRAASGTSPSSQNTGDYTPATGTATIDFGDTKIYVRVPVHGDDMVEADETLQLIVTDVVGSGVVLRDGLGIGTIENDDRASISASSVSVLEDAGEAAVAYRLDNPVQGGFAINDFQIVNQTTDANDQRGFVGSATPNAASLEFVGTPGEVQFLTVGITDDSVPEVDETLRLEPGVLQLNNAQIGAGVVAAPLAAIVTIRNDDVLPNISVSDVSQDEGSGGGFTDFRFEVRLDAPFAQTVTVDYATSGDPALAGDYETTTGTLTFAPGDVSQSVLVRVRGDALDEDDETFDLVLENPVNGILADATGVATIVNDDLANQPSFKDVPSITVLEGLGGTSPIEIPVELSHVSGRAITVEYEIRDGTARRNEDYTVDLPQGRLRFDPGETSKRVTLALRGDILAEGDERFTIVFSDPENATLPNNAVSTVTIENDDTVRFTIADVSVPEDVGDFTSEYVRVENDFVGVIEVEVESADGTATVADSDYTPIRERARFVDGFARESRFFFISPTPDSKVEADETILLGLKVVSSSVINLDDIDVTDGAILTLLNDDRISLSVDSPTVSEDAGVMSFTVSLTEPAPAGGVSFDFTTRGDSASAGADYVHVDDRLTFTAGQQTMTVDVDIVNETVVESDETLTATLSNLLGENVELGTSVGTGTITNDDTTTLTVADISGFEDAGDIAFELVLDTPVQGGFSILVVSHFDLENNGGGDYSFSTAPLQFSGTAGEVQRYTIALNADTDPEPDETFLIGFSSILPSEDIETGDISFDGTASLTILDDDTSVAFSVSAAEADEGEPLEFSVYLSGPVPDGGATVNYTLKSQTAELGADFAPTSGVLQFNGGTQTQSVSVDVVDDAQVEADETLILELSNPTGTRVEISKSTAFGTIRNDDTATLAVADVTGNEDDGPITVSLMLNNPVDGGFTVDATTADGSATAGADYTALRQTLAFAGTAGELQTFALIPTVDDLAEADETVSITLENVVAATVAADDFDLSDTATVTLSNDDAPPTLTLTDVQDFEEADQTAIVSVNLDAASGLPIRFAWSTAQNSASADDDYTAITQQSVTIAPGATSAELRIPLIDDDIEEGRESFFVQLSNVTNAVAPITEAEVFINASDIARPRLQSVARETPTDQRTNADTLVFRATFSENVRNVDVADFVVRGTTGNVTNVQRLSDSVYAITVSGGDLANVNGTVGLELVSGATVIDFAGAPVIVTAPSSINEQYTLDNVAPAPLFSADTGPFAGPFPVTLVFEEPMTGVEAGDIVVGNGSVRDLSTPDNMTFLFNVAPDSDGMVSVDFPVGAALDLAQNPNTAAPRLSREVDATAPSVTITALAVFANAPFDVAIRFSEAVDGFEQADLVVNNGAVSAFSTTDNITFAATITPTSSGSITVEVPASVAQDSVGNVNTASQPLVVDRDTTAPTATFGGPNGATGRDFSVSLVFSEVVQGLDTSEIQVTNGTLLSVRATNDQSFRMDLRAESHGEVIISLAAGAVADAAGNVLNQELTLSVFADLESPVIAFNASEDEVVMGAFALSITASEDLLDLTEDLFEVTGGTLIAGSLTGAGAQYSVTVEPNMREAIRVVLPAGVVRDLVGNPTAQASTFSAQVGSPEAEFTAKRIEIIGVVQQEALRRLTNGMSSNTGMMDRALDRFIGVTRTPDLVTRDIPFDVDGQISLGADQPLETAGSFFGQTVLHNNAIRTALGQFDVALDDDDNWTAQLSGRVTYEHAVSERTRWAYFLGGSLSVSDITGDFAGDADSVGLIAGGYGMAQLSEHLFADGYAALEYTYTDIGFADDTLDLEGSYGAFSYYAGGRLSGSIFTRSGIELRPQLAVDYGWAELGVLGFRADAFGTSGFVRDDFGTVSVLDLSFTPEIVIPLNIVEGRATFSLNPEVICRRTTGVSGQSDCGSGIGFDVSGQSADGRTRYGVSIDAEDVGSISQSSGQFFVEVQF
ncbi:Calx-beta domain-containing protein [Shimia sp. R11_0]|uniref:Calx-beta domain-containing protein n=1 Tax=Shimia sp. R11_0 TaxID=2821096 RepID=UPI001FFDF3F9|nr:Calx-beta domain-containing protein [Shimia sp. R11_0]